MWWYGRGNSGGSWLTEEKKANMWPGRGNSGGSWPPAFPRSHDRFTDALAPEYVKRSGWPAHIWNSRDTLYRDITCTGMQHVQGYIMYRDTTCTLYRDITCTGIQHVHGYIMYRDTT